MEEKKKKEIEEPAGFRPPSRAASSPTVAGNV